uniref:Uncharacterized protein n=1 Tax=Oryza punctata TaxID=4537 RepID=A0A0E0LG95_ORYPU
MLIPQYGVKVTDLLVSIAVSSPATSGHRITMSPCNFVDAARVFIDASSASLHHRRIGVVPALVQLGHLRSPSLSATSPPPEPYPPCCEQSIGSINGTSMLDDLRKTLDRRSLGQAN